MVKKQFVYGYHLHIYFNDKLSQKVAQELTESLSNSFSDKVNEIIHYSELVGPHTCPNYALHIKIEGFADIVGLAQLDNNGLSILVHPETGDDETDHAKRAMWIGKPLKLDMTYFDKWKNKNV